MSPDDRRWPPVIVGTAIVLSFAAGRSGAS
jgi:hypothetical protein